MQVFKQHQTTDAHLKQPMFLGESVTISRFDSMRLPWVDKFTEKQLGFFWRPEEVDVTKDSIDFSNLTEAEQFMFVANLKYQTLLDSVQGRGVNLTLLPIVSLPEVETWVETWAFSETIHSRSYMHIIRNIFANPSEVFDEITVNPSILARADTVTKEYDTLINLNALLQVDPSPILSAEEAKVHRKQVIKTLTAINVLEGVRFYVSFACGWSFNERGLMEGNAKILKLIARDEALHMSAIQLMLKAIADGTEGSLWQDCYNEVLPEIYSMYDEAVAQEKEWANYLFSRGTVIGLNATILSQFIEYIANTRLGALGIEKRYSTLKNPLPWINSYLSNDNVQVAPQETEISSYLTGALDTSVDISTLSLDL